MSSLDSHYDLLGLDISASRRDVEAAVERLSKRANALANTSPMRSQELRDRIRQIKEDFLESSERRDAYNRQLSDIEHSALGTSVHNPAVTVSWKVDTTAQAAHVPIARRGSITLLFLLALVVICLISGAGAFFWVHGAPRQFAAVYSTATPLPTATLTLPTPTVVPTANSNAQITQAVRRSNNIWSASMSCPCDRGLSTVKAGADLEKYLTQIQDLQNTGQRWVIDLRSWKVNSSQLDSPTTANVEITKGESRQIVQGQTVIFSCTGPYDVRYHLVKMSGVWKVDGTTLINDQCR